MRTFIDGLLTVSLIYYITICALVGAAQSSLSTVERYDPRTNNWNMVGSMSIRRSLLNVAVLDGKFDVIGLYFLGFKSFFGE